MPIRIGIIHAQPAAQIQVIGLYIVTTQQVLQVVETLAQALEHRPIGDL